MKVYYVANARMPTDKAHGIQIAKTCEAFAEFGASVTLVVSSRGSGSVAHAYGLTKEISIRRVPVLDLQFLGPIGYRLTALQFVLGALLYLWIQAIRGESFVVYTIDMDAFSFAPLALVPRPLFAEMHSVKKPGFLTRRFFKRASVVATNALIAEGLTRAFHIPPDRLRIEPNGVDESALRHELSREDARRRLGLPDEPFALYVGRLYAWKGLEILADAAAYSPLPIYLVGGTRGEYERVTGRDAGTLRFAGVKSAGEVPLWLAAADVLVVLGTARNESSYRYTSPMKIFEYLAARRATVASRTPALESIVQGNMVFWYDPDDARSLAQAIRGAYASPETKEKIQAGYAFAATHTWRQRAQRILACMRFAHGAGKI